MWSLAVLLGAYLAATGVTAIGKGLGNAASGLAATSDPITATTDLLFRTDKSAPPDVSETSRAEISRLLVRSAQAGEVAPTDKTYLAQIVSAALTRDGEKPAELWGGVRGEFHRCITASSLSFIFSHRVARWPHSKPLLVFVERGGTIRTTRLDSRKRRRIPLAASLFVASPFVHGGMTERRFIVGVVAGCSLNDNLLKQSL